jgi:hypothetical protein
MRKLLSFIHKTGWSVSADDAHELHPAHDRRSNQREEAERDPGVSAYAAPALNAADPMLDRDSDRRQAALLRAVLIGQVPALGFFVWPPHPGNPRVRSVTRLRRLRVVLL